MIGAGQNRGRDAEIVVQPLQIAPQPVQTSSNLLAELDQTAASHSNVTLSGMSATWSSM